MSTFTSRSSFAIGNACTMEFVVAARRPTNESEAGSKGGPVDTAPARFVSRSYGRYAGTSRGGGRQLPPTPSGVYIRRVLPYEQRRTVASAGPEGTTNSQSPPMKARLESTSDAPAMTIKGSSGMSFAQQTATGEGAQAGDPQICRPSRGATVVTENVRVSRRRKALQTREYKTDQYHVRPKTRG